MRSYHAPSTRVGAGGWSGILAPAGPETHKTGSIIPPAKRPQSRS